VVSCKALTDVVYGERQGRGGRLVAGQQEGERLRRDLPHTGHKGLALPADDMLVNTHIWRSGCARSCCARHG